MTEDERDYCLRLLTQYADEDPCGERMLCMLMRERAAARIGEYNRGHEAAERAVYLETVQPLETSLEECKANLARVEAVLATHSVDTDASEAFAAALRGEP